MRVNLCSARITFFLILTPLLRSFPQLDLKLNGELGYFNSSGTELVKYNDLLVRLDGEIKYKIEGKKKSASILIKGRPEFFRLNSSWNSLKLKAEANYTAYEEILSWGLDISRQKNIYGRENSDLEYDILILIGDVSWYFFDNFPITTNIGYAFQTVNEIYEHDHDMLFFDLKVYHSVLGNLRLGYGFYSERFTIENNIRNNIQMIENRNSGWRGGPQISLNYLKNILINADYRFLFHSSKFTEYPSFEQWIRIVAGIIFLPGWSAFVLVDYYSREFKSIDLPEEQLTLTYSPLNLENRIYLKIGCEITDNIELYIKSGYFKENLYRNKYLFAGWNSLIGFELNN